VAESRLSTTAKAQNKVVVAERRRKVSNLALSRLSVTEIAKQLSVCQATVSNDLKKIREEWSREHQENIGSTIVFELASLSRDEARLRATLASLPEDDHKSRARYYDLILKVMDRRHKILGLDAPQKVDYETREIKVNIIRVEDWREIEG